MTCFIKILIVCLSLLASLPFLTANHQPRIQINSKSICSFGLINLANAQVDETIELLDNKKKLIYSVDTSFY